MAWKARVVLLSIVGALVAPIAAYAEVSDKEPSIAFVWTWALVGSLVPWILGRRWPWTMALTLPAGLLFAVGVFFENAELQGAIEQEAPTYLVQAALSGALVIASHVAAFVRRRTHIRA